MSSQPSRPRVFISAKSEDYDAAGQVFGHLVAAGLQAFFSRESLPELGNADYRREIDRALDDADHMVVVTSAVEHVQSPWVEAEWGFFINEKRSGRKAGNIVTVLVGGLAPAKLPPSLRNYEAIPFDQRGLDRLTGYLGVAARPGAQAGAASTPAAVQSWRVTATLGAPPGVAIVRASESGDLIVTGGVDGALRVYDRRTLSRRAVLGSRRYWAARHEGLVTALALSGDGRYVASGHLDGAIHVWDVAGERELGERKHDIAIGGLVFLPEGQTLVSGSRDGVVRCWDIAALDAGTGIAFATTKPAPVVHLGCLPKSGWLVSGLVNTASARYALQLDKMSRPDRTVATLNLAAPFRHLAASADETALATAGGDGQIRLYDLAAVAEALSRKQHPRLLPLAAEFKAHTKAVSSLAWFPDGRSLATCAMGAVLIVWDLDTRQPRLRLQGDANDAFAGVAIVRNGSMLVSGLADGRIRLWEAA